MQQLLSASPIEIFARAPKWRVSFPVSSADIQAKGWNSLLVLTPA